MSRLHFKKYPEQDGVYVTGNHNELHSRLEIETVRVVGKEVFIDGDEYPYIFTDFDFWSDVQE